MAKASCIPGPARWPRSATGTQLDGETSRVCLSSDRRSHKVRVPACDLLYVDTAPRNPRSKTRARPAMMPAQTAAVSAPANLNVMVWGAWPQRQLHRQHRSPRRGRPNTSAAGRRATWSRWIPRRRPSAYSNGVARRVLSAQAESSLGQEAEVKSRRKLYGCVEVLPEAGEH